MVQIYAGECMYFSQYLRNWLQIIIHSVYDCDNVFVDQQYVHNNVG